MKVSVIIPVHDVSRFLPACLDSLCAQTFREWECLLIDDGSSDDSFDICRTYAARDTRFSVLHTENRGAYAARNIGLSRADGDAVYFCDSDDILHPDLLSGLVAALGSTSADFAYVDADEFPEDGTPDFRPPSGNPVVVEDPFSSYVRRECGLALWHCLFRRESLTDISFDEDIRRGADRLFMYRYLARSPRMARIDAVLYGYRQRDGSVAHAPIGSAAVRGYADVMRRLATSYAGDPRLSALRKGEFVYIVKYMVRECERNPSAEDLQRCRETTGELFREGVLRLRDFGMRWGWRVFRFSRKPRIPSA